MAASVSVRVYNGSGAGTQSSPVTGIDLASDDTADNDLSHRQANPIPVGGVSYEKWLRARIDTAPANAVGNFQVWGDGTVQASTHLMFTGEWVTGTTPVNVTSSIADDDFTDYTAGNKAAWDTASYSATGSLTKFLVFQLQVDSDASAGNWTQETISYSYDET